MNRIVQIVCLMFALLYLTGLAQASQRITGDEAFNSSPFSQPVNDKHATPPMRMASSHVQATWQIRNRSVLPVSFKITTERDDCIVTPKSGLTFTLEPNAISETILLQRSADLACIDEWLVLAVYYGSDQNPQAPRLFVMLPEESRIPIDRYTPWVERYFSFGGDGVTSVPGSAMGYIEHLANYKNGKYIWNITIHIPKDKIPTKPKPPKITKQPPKNTDPVTKPPVQTRSNTRLGCEIACYRKVEQCVDRTNDFEQCRYGTHDACFEHCENRSFTLPDNPPGASACLKTCFNKVEQCINNGGDSQTCIYGNQDPCIDRCDTSL